jgi:hypothetical protein
VRRLAVFVALAAAGCGGGTSSTLTQLRAHATTICTAANVRSYRIPSPTWKAGAGRFLKSGIDVLSPELKGLKRLSSPSGEADVYAAGVGALSDEIDALRSAASAISRSEDPVIAYQALQRRLTPLEAQANDAWGALEIPACAS